MADNNAEFLNPEAQIDSAIDTEAQIDSELNPSAELESELENIIEISHEYTGVDTEDIDVTVDNTNYTISAVLTNERREQLDNIPEKTSDLTNDGEDGTSPFATQEYVEENGGKIDSISVNGTPQTIDADKNVDIDVPTALSDLTNDANFVQDASYVHTDNNYTTEEKNKLSGVQNGAQVNAIEHIAVDGVEQTITDKSVNIDLSGKQDVLTAGDNIDITNNEISAKDVVTTNTNQEITSDKTFDYGNKVSFEIANGNKYGLSGNQYNYLQVDYNGVGMYSFGTQQIFPNSNNSRDLGTSGLKWRNFFVQGNLSDGTNSISIAKIQDSDKALQKISDHENFAGVTGDQAYKCIGGATINGWFAIGGVQRECLYINLTAYSGTTYRFWGIFRNSGDNKYVNLQGTVSGVESGSSTNVTWTVTKTIDIDSEKQDKLTAGTNITIDANNVISATGGGTATDVKVDGTSITSNNEADLQTINGDYDASTNKLATASDLPNISSTDVTITEVD